MKAEAYSPEMGEWQVWKKWSEKFFVMYRQQNGSITFAPLYIHSFPFVIPKNRANICKFQEQYPNPELIDHTGMKIRYYRYQKDLHQKDLADYVGFTRPAMVYYESTERDYYEIDILKKFSEILEVELEDLLDDYNMFLYQGQAARLKEFRKENHLTQKQLAKFLGVDVTKIKGWEQSRVRMSKASYNKFVSFEKSFCKNRKFL